MPEQLPPAIIGVPLRRVDGHQKVTGAARYAADNNLPGGAHGVLVTSTVARGRITALDTAAAERAPGVLAVLTYRNAPPVPGYSRPVPDEKKRVAGQELRVFQDEQIHFSNQPVALAIARTLEQAQHAAALVRVAYAAEPPQTDLAAHLTRGVEPQRSEDYARGQPDAHRTAPVRVAQTYTTPMHVHNPLEMHAAVAAWSAPDQLTVYNKTQAPTLARQDHGRLFGLPEAHVQVLSPFVGGAFGCSSRLWPQEVAAVLGARLVGRPVKVLLTRPQEFNMAGYRPRSVQKIAIGAEADGTLVGITHEAFGVTSRYEEFVERILHPTKSAYQCPNLSATYRLVPLDLSTPCWMRGPGETTGSFALESAMDELAYALNMDPLALRLKNFADADPADGRPWSSNYLRACYQQGAERFGWDQRHPAPRATVDGEWLVGVGMATGIYHASRTAASARAVLRADGTLLVQSATADVGPGTATIMTQIAADASGVAPENIRFELGNAALPPAPGQFGSHTTASVGAAVHDVCVALKQRLQALAGAENQSSAEALRRHQLPQLEVTLESKGGDEMQRYSGKSFCANFVEVRVRASSGEVRVSRVVSALDVGRVMNQRTAQSQVYGAVTWGIGMALLEEAVMDHRYGRVVNHNLAEYHVPVNADVPAIDVIFIDKPDPYLDPMGAKGMGEIGLIGFAAAVANAVYHATGRRVRELPITPDKLL